MRTNALEWILVAIIKTLHRRQNIGSPLCIAPVKIFSVDCMLSLNSFVRKINVRFYDVEFLSVKAPPDFILVFHEANLMHCHTF